MGLSSVFSTSITGLNAAQTTIDVVGNNIANANTNGFKASEADFATQFLQTLSLGSAPTAANGGTNPQQIGLGSQVAAITPNFTQGTIQISSNPSDLAIQGDGFFVVQSDSGEQLYTRNGSFQLNSANQLVTATGQRLQGFGANSNYQIQTTSLTSLTIPLGSAAIAQATQNVFLTGTLPDNGQPATTASIIESGVLGDGTFAPPPRIVPPPRWHRFPMSQAPPPRRAAGQAHWRLAIRTVTRSCSPTAPADRIHRRKVFLQQPSARSRSRARITRSRLTICQQIPPVSTRSAVFIARTTPAPAPIIWLARLPTI